MKLFNAIVDRLALCCALICMALFGLLFPESAKEMLAEEFSTDEGEKENFTPETYKNDGES